MGRLGTPGEAVETSASVQGELAPPGDGLPWRGAGGAAGRTNCGKVLHYPLVCSALYGWRSGVRMYAPCLARFPVREALLP